MDRNQNRHSHQDTDISRHPDRYPDRQTYMQVSRYSETHPDSTWMNKPTSKQTDDNMQKFWWLNLKPAIIYHLFSTLFHTKLYSVANVVKKSQYLDAPRTRGRMKFDFLLKRGWGNEIFQQKGAKIQKGLPKSQREGGNGYNSRSQIQNIFSNIIA